LFAEGVSPDAAPLTLPLSLSLSFSLSLSLSLSLSRARALSLSHTGSAARTLTPYSSGCPIGNILVMDPGETIQTYNPTPYTLHPTLDTQNLTPYTLNPTP